MRLSSFSLGMVTPKGGLQCSSLEFRNGYFNQETRIVHMSRLRAAQYISLKFLDENYESPGEMDPRTLLCRSLSHDMLMNS